MFPDPGPPAGAEEELTFTTAEVSQMAGISLRQLQWWDQRKVVSPSHRHHRRLYRPPEILELFAIAALRRKGLPLQKIRRVLRALRKELAKQVSRSTTGRAKLYLMTDGSMIHLDERPEAILKRAVEWRGAVYVLCLSDYLHCIASAKAARRRAKQLPLF